MKASCNSTVPFFSCAHDNQYEVSRTCYALTSILNLRGCEHIGLLSTTAVLSFLVS